MLNIGSSHLYHDNKCMPFDCSTVSIVRDKVRRCGLYAMRDHGFNKWCDRGDNVSHKITQNPCVGITNIYERIYLGVRLWTLNDTFNNISVLSWDQFYFWILPETRRICFICGKHFAVLSSFMTYHWVWYWSNRTGATSRAGTAYLCGAPEFTPGFVLLDLWFSV